MKIKVVGLDLESIDDMTLNQLVKDVGAIDLTNGYSRNDLESIESKLPGAFTDVEDFDFREIPTGISKVNLNLVDKRIFEIRHAIGQGIINRYHTYINIYSSLVYELNGILDCIDYVKDDTPTPVVDSIDSVYLYNDEYNSYNLNTVVFSNHRLILTKIRLLRDATKNDRINNFNYIIDDILGDMNDLSDCKPEYRFSILKGVLGSTEITYSNAVSLFSNSNNLREFINNTTTELLDVLSNLKELINCDMSNDEVHNRWVTNTVRLDKYTAISNDRASLKLIKLLATFRYFDKYKNNII